MAKTAPKSAAKTTKKTPAKTSKAKSAGPSLEKVSEEALDKLKSLNVEPELQNDLEWCLGSYRADGNPVGLYAMAERAISVFKTEKEKKTKGVTAKLISDLEKAIESR
jgi:hypothetical protein